MKWLLYILASLMLILPCLPCKAAEACCTETAACLDEQDEHAQEPTNDHQQEDHSPVCPCCPFFACNSCHCIIASYDIIALPLAPVALAAMSRRYTETFLSFYAPAVWQPPKA